MVGAEGAARERPNAMPRLRKNNSPNDSHRYSNCNKWPTLNDSNRVAAS